MVVYPVREKREVKARSLQNAECCSSLLCGEVEDSR
jgi:hypothetical protein